MKMDGKRVMTAFLGLALFMAAGCTGTKSVSRAPEARQERVVMSPALRELYREAATDARMVESIDGYADIYLTTPKRDSRAYCTVQVQRSKGARLIVTAGLFGWPVADMLIRPDSLFVHDMLNNRLMVGRNNGENLEKVLGVRGGFSQVAETLFGMAGMAEPESAIRSVTRGEGKVSYTLGDAGGKKVLLVDEASRAIEAMTLFDTSGRKSVEFRFSAFQEQRVGDSLTRVPKEIDMEFFRPDELTGSRRLRVVYDERVINPPNLQIGFRWPKKARLVNLDDVEKMPWL